MPKNVDIFLRVGMKDSATKEIKRFESSVIRTVGAISAAFAGIKAIVFPVTEAAQFERAMADVAKTTGYTDEQITRLSASLVDMSKNLGTGAQDLAEISAIAGQLGLGEQGRKSVEAFTESVARASVTLGLAVTQTAEGGAQLSAIFGKSVAEVEKVFSTINELSNNSVAAGKDLIDIMKRVGTTSGAAFTDVAALAATARQVGVPNEQAGTGLVKFLGNLLAESEKFADAMGKTQTEWIRQVQTNSTEALKEVLSVLAQMEAAESASLTKELFGSGRLYALASKLVGDAANNFEILSKMQNLANKGFREGTSSIDEYTRIMDTVVKQTDVLKASFFGLSIEVGNKVLPALQAGIESLSATLQEPDVILFFEEVGESMRSALETIIDMIKWVADLDINWRNVVQVIKILVGIKVGKALLVWAFGLKTLLVPLIAFVGWVTRANIQLIALAKYIKASNAAATAGGLGGVLGSLYSNANKQAQQTQKLLTGTVVATGALATGLGKLGAVFGKLKLAINGLFGPAGFLVGLLATAIYGFRKEIAGFFGIVLDNERELERKQTQAEREYEKKKAEVIADQREFRDQMEKLFDNSGQYAGEEITVELLADTDGFRKAVVELTSDMALFNKTVENNKEASAGLQSNMEQYAAGMITASDKIKELEQQMESLISFAQVTERTNFNPLEDGQMDRLEEQLASANEELENNREQFYLAREELESFNESAERAGETLEGVITETSVALFDRQTAAYAKLTYQLKTQQEEMSKLIDRRSELEKISASSEGLSGEDKEELIAITREFNRLREAAAATQNSMNKISEGFSDNQNQLKGVIDDADLDRLYQTQQLLSEMELKNGDQIAAQLRNNTNEILYNHIALKRLKEGYDLIGQAAQAYAKTAKAAFDNTGNEIIALNRKIAQFAVDFKNEFDGLKIDIELDTKLDNIDDEYDERRDEVEAFYDARIAIADDATKKYLELKKKEKLADLDNQQTREEADAKAKSLRQEFNSYLERSVELMQDAQDAAEDGKIDKALALKKASKQDLELAQETLSELQSIKTVNIFGKTDLKVPRYELNEMLGRVTDVGTELGEGIKETNVALDTSATAVAEKWAKVTKDLGQRFEASEKVIDKMKQTFDNFPAILRQAEESFDTTATKFQAVVDDITEASRNPFEGAQLLDPSDLSTALSDGLNEGFNGIEGKAKGFAETVGAELALQLQEASGAFRFERAIDAAGVAQNTRTKLEKELGEKPVKVNVKLEADTNNLKKAIEQETYEVEELVVRKLKIEEVEGGVTAEARARGGYIRGPGTATSDSIPAWLSNGEYVIDAFTTGFFGSSFFANLQAMARGGRKASGFKGGIPAMAGGGSVGSGSSNVGSITLNLGGKSYTLYGERRQAQEVVSAFKNMQRG